MSDFPSIQDLQSKEKEKKDDQKTGPHLQVSSTEVEEKFQKKMGNIAVQEKEREAFRFAQSIGLPHIDLEKLPVSTEALRQLPKARAKELKAVCFFSAQDEIRIGAVDPTKEEVKELLYQLEERNHAKGILYVISEHSLKKVLKLYETLPVIKPISKDVEIKTEDLEKVQAKVNDFSSLQEILKTAATSNLLVAILGAGLKLNASDIHVEAEEEQIVVRYRLDGVLHDAAILNKDSYKKLVSRIKLTSSLKINITDKPQDGRFTIKIPSGEVDVRVSILPSVHGESVVMRLLMQSRKGLTLDNLGLIGKPFEKLEKEIKRPNGMIIITGPTGSGKTTTLYAIMQILNKPNVKIITLEDPVEYRMEGITQSQIDKSKEYTFARGLKSILRQDPDIAMVGEIRDLETAEIAIQAALTGHLLLSTIHTNSAAGAVPRFLSMGAKPFLLMPALNAVIGQRLVRKLCEKCKKKIEVDSKRIKEIEAIIAGMPDETRQKIEKMDKVFYGPGQCDECSGLGYKGRIGIFEIMIINQTIEEMVAAGHVSESELQTKAIKDGMITMVQDGIIKALEGQTSLDEVFRVTE